jgi:hypothetical protein
MYLKQIVVEKGKSWYIFKEGCDEPLMKLKLISCCLTNKFDKVAELVDDINSGYPEFSKWLDGFFVEYIDSKFNAELVVKNFDIVLDFCSKYCDSKKVPFESFLKKSKITKTSIIFEAEDIRYIMILSIFLKLYGIICYEELMKLPEDMNRQVMYKLTKIPSEMGLVSKMFQLVRSLTYRTNLHNKYGWDFCRYKSIETPESHIMSIFNYILSNLISIVEIDKNPIPFIAKTIECSITWLMKTVHDQKIIYSDTFYEPEDVFSSQTKYSFDVYCCADIMGKVAAVGLDILSKKCTSDDNFNGLRARLDSVTDIYPYTKLVILPLISKILGLNYKYLISLPPEHTILAGVFINELCDTAIIRRFPNTSKFFTSCPRITTIEDELRLSKKVTDFIYTGGLDIASSYKIKSIEYAINEHRRIFGFNSPLLKYKMLSALCGVLIASRRNLVSILDGKPLNKVPNSELEEEFTNFFMSFYSGELDKPLEKMRKVAENVYF